MNEVTPVPVSNMFRNENLQAKEKLTDWKKPPTLETLKSDFDLSKPFQKAQASKIRGWLDQLNVEGAAKPKAIPTRSQVQPKLIRRQAEWRYSALSEPFLGSDKLFNVEPATFEDEFAAKQNELVLNWQFRTKINTVKFIDEYVRATVDEGTAIIKLGWNRQVITEKKEVPIWEYVPAQAEQEISILQQAMQLMEQNPSGFYDLPEEIQVAVEYTMQHQVPVKAYAVGTEEVEEDRIIENRPTVNILHYDNVYIDPSCEGDINNARFIIYSFETSKAELMKDGRYKNLDVIDWESSSILAEPDHTTSIDNNFNFKDEMRKRIVAYEYWGYYDFNDDGVLKPFVATWIGNILIRMEENPFPDEKLPFVLVPYMPIKRSVYGEADANILEDNQKILGAVTRGMIDLMGRSANGQIGYAKGMLDVTNRRKFERGEDYEFNPNQNISQMLLEHKYPEIPQSAMLMLQLQNQEAEALTGVKSFSGGISGEAYGKVAAGIRGMLDAASKREMAILRRLAKGIKEIGEKIVSMNSAFLSEKEVIRITNSKYVEVKREDLAGNFDLMVDISTAEVDEAKSQDLGFMLQTLGNNMDNDMRNMILSEIATLKRMPTLAQKIATYQPQPDPLLEKAKELEVKKLELEIAELQSKINLNNAKASEAQSNADLKDLDYVEQETGTKHERDLQKQKAQAQGNQNLAITKALLEKTKPEEKKGDVEAAIGYNKLSDAIDEQSLQRPQPELTSNPELNIGSSYYDPSQDPALNQRHRI